MRGTAEKSLAYLFPEIVSEWNSEKNGELTPDKVAAHANFDVWWKCNLGHEWLGSVAGRTRHGRIGAGCPYCNNRKLLEGFNDLATRFPHIAQEWNLERNGEKRPDKILFNSTDKIWWRCSKCGFDNWQTAINNRTGNSHGGGCPYCTGQVVWPGHNDLQTLFPQIASEWDYEKNDGLSPSQVTAKSDKIVFWKCPSCNSSYPASLGNRTRAGSACPQCGVIKAIISKHQRRIDAGDTIASKYPQIAAEWDYEKNTTTPDCVVPGSHDVFNWLCSRCNHSWSANAYVRTVMGCGCPKCSKSKHTSFPEQILFYYLKQVFPNAKNSYKPKWLAPAELDIYIPSLHIGIEYDGAMWHHDAQKDQAKVDIASEHNIRMLRIREEGLPVIDNCECLFVSTTSAKVSSTCFDAMVNDVFSAIFRGNTDIPQLDINVERDSPFIIGTYVSGSRKDSLLVKYPEIAKELHPTKNGTLSADSIAFGSNQKLWWLCSKCGTEYSMKVCNRTFLGQGCKLCNLGRIKIRVRCIETGEVFESITSAAHAHNMKSSSSINKVLSGERNTAGGCHWEYLDAKKSKRPVNRLIHCIEIDRTFPSLAEAERVTCIDHHTISRCLKGDVEKAGGYHWKYIENS